MSSKLKQLRPSPAMVVALVALVAALGGTAYAAGQINGNSIQKQSIGGGKLKQKTLTGYQINTRKLGIVPAAEKADNVFWAVVNNPTGVWQRHPRPGQQRRHHRSRGQRGRHRDVPGQRQRLRRRRLAQQRRHHPAGAGTAQTNSSAANANAIEVHTYDDKGQSTDSDFHLLVVCPSPIHLRLS